MADYALFIGWGATRTGKEKAAAKVFEESVAYMNGLKSAGEVESVDLVLLSPHGGDLSGFALLQGEPEKLARIRMTPEFRRLVLRSTVCQDGFGVVTAFVNGGVMAAMQEWNAAIADMI